MPPSPPEDRLPPLDPAHWTAAQRTCAQEIIAGPRGALVSPFVPLLRSPELCTHAQRMGEYLRYRSAIGQRLSELVILVTARFWDQPVEWAIHAPIAQAQGITAAVVRAIEQRQTPAFDKADEQLAYDMAHQLLHDKRVDDPTWAAVCAQFGEQGAMDLSGIVGYYSLLSMVMNAARTPPPPGSTWQLGAAGI
jgi:4-carboxymuconolactone decarboxylase